MKWHTSITKQQVGGKNRIPESAAVTPIFLNKTFVVVSNMNKDQVNAHLMCIVSAFLNEQTYFQGN